MPNQQTKIDNTITEVRSKHNLSFNWLGTADFGRLVPFHWQELIGTDKIETLRPSIEMQMLPLASPTFGRLDLYVHYFFCPSRLLWDDFTDFYSASGPGEKATPPYMTPSTFNVIYEHGGMTGQEYMDWIEAGNSVSDVPSPRPLYKHWTSFGLPDFWIKKDWPIIGGSAADKISTLPFRAYNQVWWDFFRDPELVPDSNRSKYLRTDGGEENYDNGSFMYVPRVRSIKDVWFAELFKNNGGTPGLQYLGIKKPAQNNPALEVNVLTQADGSYSRQMRTMEALTRLAERMSLSGKRQIDQLFTQYGIKPQFDKLKMCQYLGGAKQSVLVSDITSTANTTGFDAMGASEIGVSGSPLGAKAGQGYCTFNELDIDFTATEPGYVIGVFSVMPQIHFVQGLGKEWFRNDIYDWFHRELEHTGQVAVPKKEIGYTAYQYDIATGNGTTTESAYYDSRENDHTFAFTQPYYDYKRKMDVIAGDFLWYHDDDSDGDVNDVAYMQSMGLYVNFPRDRQFNPENLLLPANKMNKIFYYLGGSIWDDVDDHFHVNIDVKCIINRPMDGYAIPTLETTANPHAATTPIGNSTML